MSLERDIDDLLAVDHSPEFVATVRQRIAAEPPPAATWLSWNMVPVASGVAAITMALLLWPAGTPAPTVQGGLALTNGSPVAPLAPTSASSIAPIAPTSVRTIAPTSASSIAPLAPTSASPIAPEVLLSANDRRAFGVLLTRLREDALPDMTESTTASEAAGPPWIEIPPVVIVPIADLGAE